LASPTCDTLVPPVLEHSPEERNKKQTKVENKTHGRELVSLVAMLRPGFTFLLK